MIYQCIKCKYGLKKEKSLFEICPKCGFICYKINDIPIVIENIKDYISDKLFSFTSNINKLEKIIQSISLLKRQSLENEKTIEIIKKKIDLLESFRNDLMPYSDIENLLHKAFDFKEQGYDLSYDYLLRDWGDFKETEKENIIIYKNIKSKIKKIEDSKALVVGAGLGRLAVELTKDFESVFAIDLSYEMGALFNRIKKSPMDVEAVLLKNSRYDSKNYIGTTIKSSKMLKVAASKKNLSKIKYFISDIKNLPFTNNSIDAIISCYFTDVLPIEEYFYEIDRVLKEDGNFIHFGPLDYHFENDFTKILSISELTNYFQDRGYSIEIFDSILLEHISIPIRGLKKIYNNWFFKANKKKKYHRNIDTDSVLQLNGLINYEIYKRLSVDGNSDNYKDKIKIHTPIGTIYECYIDIINIIQKFDGKKSINEIFFDLEKHFNMNDQIIEKLLNIFTDLLEKQILCVVK